MSDTVLGALITVIIGLSTILGVLLKKKPNGNTCKFEHPDLKPLEDKMQAVMNIQLNHNDLCERTHENVHAQADISNEMAKNIALMHQSQERMLHAQDEMMKTLITFCAKLS